MLWISRAFSAPRSSSPPGERWPNPRARRPGARSPLHASRRHATACSDGCPDVTRGRLRNVSTRIVDDQADRERFAAQHLCQRRPWSSALSGQSPRLPRANVPDGRQSSGHKSGSVGDAQSLSAVQPIAPARYQLQVARRADGGEVTARGGTGTERAACIGRDQQSWAVAVAVTLDSHRAEAHRDRFQPGLSRTTKPPTLARDGTPNRSGISSGTSHRTAPSSPGSIFTIQPL